MATLSQKLEQSPVRMSGSNNKDNSEQNPAAQGKDNTWKAGSHLQCPLADRDDPRSNSDCTLMPGQGMGRARLTLWADSRERRHACRTRADDKRPQ